MSDSVHNQIMNKEEICQIKEIQTKTGLDNENSLIDALTENSEGSQIKLMSETLNSSTLIEITEESEDKELLKSNILKEFDRIIEKELSGVMRGKKYSVFEDLCIIQIFSKETKFRRSLAQKYFENFRTFESMRSRNKDYISKFTLYELIEISNFCKSNDIHDYYITFTTNCGLSYIGGFESFTGKEFVPANLPANVKIPTEYNMEITDNAIEEARKKRKIQIEAMESHPTFCYSTKTCINYLLQGINPNNLEIKDLEGSENSQKLQEIIGSIQVIIPRNGKREVLIHNP